MNQFGLATNMFQVPDSLSGMCQRFGTIAYIVISYEELLADVASRMGFKMS